MKEVDLSESENRTVVTRGWGGSVGERRSGERMVK
jgi:hypothetical protein